MSKRKSFTLIEILIVTSLLVIILAGILLLFNVGQSSLPRGLAQVEAGSRSRLILNRVVNDLRSAYLADIANNNPSCSYIKFRKVKGIDTSDGNYILAENYIEYSYDQEAESLFYFKKTQEGDVLSTVEYQNISQDIFYTLNSEGNKICLNRDDLNARKFIIVDLVVAEQIAGGGDVSFSLSQKVKIRNE